MSQPRALHLCFTSSFLTGVSDSGLAEPGSMVLSFFSPSERQKMPTRNGFVDLLPKQRQATGGVPMQGKPKMPGNLGHGAQTGKKQRVRHSHLCGILELAPSAEALHHRKQQLYVVARAMVGLMCSNISFVF